MTNDGVGDRRSARVPTTRAERVGRLGTLLAGIAGETALEVLRRAAGGEADGALVLNEANTKRVRDTLADLRGAAMKLGQLLSLQGEDLLPPEIASVLSDLRNHARFMPEDQVRTVLEAELGPDWRDRFAEFDQEPLAAASIGQVHAAQTVDGRDLALKLQYPGVADSISGDVDNLVLFLRLTRLVPAEFLDDTELLDELKSELAREADYHQEAENTERYRALVADDPGVFVPRVHRDLSTRALLATDRVYALPVEDLRSPEHSRERRARIGERMLRLVFAELFQHRFMQTDPNFANYLYEPKHERIALLDFGAARELPEPLVQGYRKLVMALVEGQPADVHRHAQALGFLRGDEEPAALRAFEALCALFGEPLRARGAYDFAASDLASRVREHSLDVLREHRLPRPPTGTLFLHRKLAGSFLLFSHIGASIDCGALYREQVRDPLT